MTHKTIATILHCSKMPIPVEFEDKAAHLAAKYVKDFSLSGLYAMDYNIVYNRVCNLIHTLLAENPAFALNTFSCFLNVNTLFYSVTDIQTLVLAYKENPQAVFPYVICFFARKLISFKCCKISYIKGLEREDVDEVMMIAVHKTLDRYTPEHPFSFSYLEMELFAAITQLGGEMHPFGLPRNDFTNYLKFSYLIEKYMLTPENINQFLYEINLTDAARMEQKDAMTFSIDEQDRNYSCSFSLRKAMDYYTLYSIENQGIVNALSYDEDADMVIDNTGAIIEAGYETAELALYAKQTFSNPDDQHIFLRLTQPGGSTFTNRELRERYNSTRYRVNQIKDSTKNELF